MTDKQREIFLRRLNNLASFAGSLVHRAEVMARDYPRLVGVDGYVGDWQAAGKVAQHFADLLDYATHATDENWLELES